MKTTIELIEWLEVESKLAKEDDSAVSAAYLRDAALRLRELEVQLQIQFKMHIVKRENLTE